MEDDIFDSIFPISNLSLIYLYFTLANVQMSSFL